jgi:hypothetical protein
VTALDGEHVTHAADAGDGSSAAPATDTAPAAEGTSTVGEVVGDARAMGAAVDAAHATVLGAGARHATARARARRPGHPAPPALARLLC